MSLEVGKSESPYVFVSYSRANKDIVNRLIEDLRQREIGVWIDRFGLKPGTYNWEQAIRDAIRQAQAVLFVASPNSRRSAYVQDELSIAEMYKRPIFPVWVQGEDWIDCIPMGLGKIQRVDLRNDGYPTGLIELLETLGKPYIQVKEATPPAHSLKAPRNPYKGLVAFNSRDEGDFFGRDLLIMALVERLEFIEQQKTGNFLAVIGASGSGKSSVVMAGLMPRLRKGVLPHSQDWTYLPPLLPGSDPVMALALTLSSVLPTKSVVAILEDLNAPSGLGLHHLARSIVLGTGGRLVLFVDQFEELFTQTTDDKKRNQFIDLVMTAVTESDSATMVICTLRAIFMTAP